MDKKGKRYLLVFAALVAVILVSNLPAARLVYVRLGVEPIIRSYPYVSGDGQFDEFEVPEKGRNLTMVEAHFADYKERTRQPGLILYRSFRPNWWRFWKWREYCSHPRWAYPYREPVADADQ
jgi:hypothetical protein